MEIAGLAVIINSSHLFFLCYAVRGTGFDPAINNDKGVFNAISHTLRGCRSFR